MRDCKISTSKCCTCGYSWCTGTDGTHSCSSVLVTELKKLKVESTVRIKELESMLCFLVKNDSINDSSIDKEIVTLLDKTQ